MVLCELTSKYVRSSKEALAKLDAERHNIQYFMTTLQNRVDQILYIEAISCFSFALTTEYLVYRFTPEELVRPVRSIVTYLTVMLSDHVEDSKLAKYFSKYVNYISFLVSLTETLEGRAEAVKLFMKRVDIIEKLGNIILDTNKYYIQFYRHLLTYESELDNDTVKLYHERVLRKTVSTLHCQMCDNEQVGSAYFELGDYAMSIKFFERELSGGHKKLLAAYKLHILLQLRLAYTFTRDWDKMYECERKLIDMYTYCINEASSIVYKAMNWYIFYAGFLIEVSESDKALALIERMYEALFDLGRKEDTFLNTAGILALALYKLGEYHRAAKVASYALEHIKKLSEQTLLHEKIGLHMILNRATYQSKNFGDANKLFVDTIKFLINSNLTTPYTLDFTECCFYLMYLKNFDYFSICMPFILPKAYEYINPYLQGIAFILFQIPFVKPDSQSEPATEQEDLPLELYPQIIKQSKSKEVLLFGINKDIASDLLSRPEINTFTIVKWYYWFVISFDYIIFILNFATVFIRLVVLYYFIKLCFHFFFWCTKFVFNLRPVTWILEYLFFHSLKLYIVLPELTS